MFAVGVGDGVNNFELDGIANKPSTDFKFLVKDFDSFAAIQDALISGTCDVIAGMSNHSSLPIASFPVC